MVDSIVSVLSSIVLLAMVATIFGSGTAPAVFRAIGDAFSNSIRAAKA